MRSIAGRILILVGSVLTAIVVFYGLLVVSDLIEFGQGNCDADIGKALTMLLAGGAATATLPSVIGIITLRDHGYPVWTRVGAALVVIDIGFGLVFATAC